MPTTTANLGLTLPTPNVDTGWGSTLNTDFTLIDNLFTAAGTGTSVGINVGTGKTLGIGGTLLLGSGDGTGTVTAPTIRGAARTGTNVVGANLTIDAANGTGSGGSGSLIFRTAPAGTGGGGINPNTMQDSVIISSNGNVGIGAASGGSRLSVRGGNNNVAVLDNDGSQYTNIYWSNNGTTKVNAYWDQINTAFGLIPQAASSKLILGSAGFERMRITETGAFSFGVGGTSYGSAGQVLQSNGNTVPSWVTPSISTWVNIGQNLALSGASWPVSVNLSAYNSIVVKYDAVSGTQVGGSTFLLNGAAISSTTGTTGATHTGMLWIELLSGYCYTGIRNAVNIANTLINVTTGTATLTFSRAGGTMTGGSVVVYGVR